MKKKIIGILAIILILVVGITCKMMQRNKLIETSKRNEIEKMQIESQYAKLTDIYIYGTHLNIEGNIDLKEDEIETIVFVLANEDEQLEYPLQYEVKNSKIQFTTCEFINKGIDLEKIKKEKNAFLIKVKEKSGANKYYSIDSNEMNIKELEYYTISNNNRTNYIMVKEIEKEEKSYLILSLENIEMPENIYDITLDAGHGGENPGAVYKGYHESDIVLDYTLKLKEKLEKEGLKVALTRSADVKTEEYGEEGRAVIPNKVKSKYTFSIHLNSNVSKQRSGVEIYAPSRAELSFAKLLANNIVEYAKTIYSDNEIDKVYEGVYVRTFTKEEIKQSSQDAKKDGYEIYQITEDTPYLFMIRETGGKITNAYVDGRNKEYAKNLYYNTSVGNESYLLELGYINSEVDLSNLLNNQQEYLEAIAQSILSLVDKK